MNKLLGALTGLLKNLPALLRIKGLERLVLNILVGVWVSVFLVTFAAGFFMKGPNQMEDKMKETASKSTLTVMPRADLQPYEDVLTKAKYPEGLEHYASLTVRDPFTEAQKPEPADTGVSEHDFALTAIENIPLPIMYKGFIQLEDRLIAQLDLEGETKFAGEQAVFKGYTVLGVNRGYVDIRLPDGTEHRLEYKKPLLSDELGAVLFDRVSQRKVAVTKKWALDGYTVSDINGKGIVLSYNGKKIEFVLP